MAKAKKTKKVEPKFFEVGLTFYARGPVKKIPSVSYTYEPGIDGALLDSEVFTTFEKAALEVASLLKNEGYI